MTLLIIIVALALLPLAIQTALFLLGIGVTIMEDGRWKYIIGVPAALIALLIGVVMYDVHQDTVTAQSAPVMSQRAQCIALTYDQAGVDRCNITTPNPN